MKKAFTLLLLLSLNLQYSFSQERHIVDSLLKKLPNTKVDTNRINLLNAIGASYSKISDFEKGIQYLNDAISLSQKLNFQKGLSNAYRITSQIYYKQGRFNEAIQKGELGLQISEKLGNLQLIAGFCQNLGYYYESLGNYAVALKMQYRALKIHETLKDQHGIAGNLNNIGILYILQNQYDDALKYLAEAAAIFLKLNDPFLNHPYNNMGLVYLNQGNYKAAHEYRVKALKIREKLGDQYEIANSFEGIGSIYLAEGKYNDALIQYENALKIREKINDKFGISSVTSSIGAVYVQLKKYSIARNYINKSLALDKELGNIYGMQGNYESLSTIDSATGNYKESLENYKLYVWARDSLLNEENIKHLVQNQMQYEFDKKETITKASQEKKDIEKIKELEKQMLMRNWFIGGFVATLFFAIIIFIQRNKIKKGKLRSDELLFNILPEEVAEELKNKGSAEAKQFDEVTVLFTDFKGFTQLSEKMTAKELVGEINTCFMAFDTIMGKYGIEKIKTIGDSYMCAGGLPKINKTHAIDVVNAGMEIQQYIQKRAFESTALNKEPFEIRIGIHTGPVVAGIVGIKKFAYDIWGDTVNTASRMESSGEAGKVNISGATYALVKDKFNCIHRGKVQAKGKGEIDMYFVDGRL